MGPVLRSGARLGYVHVGENHRGYLGAGSVAFPGSSGACDGSYAVLWSSSRSRPPWSVRTSAHAGDGARCGRITRTSAGMRQTTCEACRSLPRQLLIHWTSRRWAPSRAP